MPADSLTLVRSLTWSEVFAFWRAGEAAIPRWIEHYRKKGFHSWDQWRSNTLKDVRYETLSWQLFDVKDPAQTVAHFLGGPFRAWIKNYYGGARTRTFSELARERKIQDNALVKEMVADFPAETYLVALETGAGISVIEGMHRCCALAVLAARQQAVRSKVRVALGSHPGEIPEMGSPDSPT
jgi:hypothetical protein